MEAPLDPTIAASVERDWQLSLPPKCTEEDLLALLSAQINQLILHDFSRLLSILYRVDIPEKKLRQTLRDNPKADAGRVIAVMILERQKEKKKLREMFKRKDMDVDADEKW
jgi:hypothetical protein